MELGNQDLKEIIEVGSQIIAQLDMENIIKNVVLSLFAKFQTPTVTFLVPTTWTRAGRSSTTSRA
jgi:hypothetical protein